MNILFLNSARDWGGNEHWTNIASNSLSRENGVYLAYRTEKVGSRFGIKKYRLPFLNEVDVVTISRLISIIKRHQIHLLVPTKRKEYLLAGIVSRYCRVKNVMRLGIVRNLGKKWINNLIYNKLCDGIIVNALAIKEELGRADFIDTDKIRVVYNGVDVASLEKRSREHVDFTKPFPFTIASAGNISERKGFDILIKGFSLFMKMSPNSQDCGLIILGEGPLLARYKELARELGVQSSVHFLGFKLNPYPYLKQSDLFILASRNEGISNAVLEAMAFGKPVISTKAGGIREIIEHGRNGFLMDQDNAESMANLISLIHRDPDRTDLISEAAICTAKVLSVDRMRDELSGFFKKIVFDVPEHQ
jgi:glycosyltransferase involved in cell wall biosynthesis